MDNYETFVLRNKGYIDDSLQKKIKETRLLIAGCGMGSAIAEVMLRSGFVNMVLVDADTVAPHNLNRQCFEHEDIDVGKTKALSRRLKAIYPDANIQEVVAFVSEKNASEIVDRVDLIVDTIDFVDLPGVTSLYDEADKRKIPVISAINAGFGAVALYYPHDGKLNFRQMFGLESTGSVAGISYSEKYMSIIKKLAVHLNPQIVREMSKALTIMENGKPCPASQIASGSFSAGAIAATIAIKVLAGEPVACVPNVIMLDLTKIINQLIVDLSK